ncbi:hypothetical protein H4582DRAFT_192848 [Lactarius indigo]|nr:hypothetical protein H4582DRAFT_192848 [Lactarius indigo]
MQEHTFFISTGQSGVTSLALCILTVYGASEGGHSYYNQVVPCYHSQSIQASDKPLGFLNGMLCAMLSQRASHLEH